jgi:hypothetical protein
MKINTDYVRGMKQKENEKIRRILDREGVNAGRGDHDGS